MVFALPLSLNSSVTENQIFLIIMRILIILVSITAVSTTSFSQDLLSTTSTPVVSQPANPSQPRVDKAASNASPPTVNETSILASKELGAATIAGVGVLFSALLSSLISYLTSSRLYSTEQRKLQFEAKKHYESKVVDNRIAVYPTAFAMLSDAIKDIEFRGVKKSTLETLLTDLNAWDSKNSIFLSSNAGDGCYIFRHKLKEYLEDKDIDEKIKQKDFLDKLRDEIGDVEMVLKSDIGIFGIESTKDGVFQPQQKTMEDIKKRVARKKT